LRLSDIIQTTLSISKHSSCLRCPLANSIFVPPTINHECEVLLIGEAPGKTEIKEKKPFVGRSGQLLRRYLEKYQLLDLISISNVVKCWPSTPEGSNRTPSKKELSTCGDMFIKEEISSYKKLKLVVLLGATPFSYFFPKKSFTKCRGHILREGNINFLVTLHPAACLYEKTREDEFEKNIKKIYDFLNNSLFSERDYVIIDNVETLRSVKSEILESTLMAVDIETSEIQEKRVIEPLVLKTFSIATKKNKAFGFFYECNKTLSIEYRQEAWNLLKTILEDPGITKVFHNAKFEYTQFSLRGCIPVNFRDTMLESYLLDEQRVSDSLKYLASVFTEGYQDLVTDFADTDLDKLVRYNCEDSDLTLQIHSIFFDLIKKDSNLLKVYDELLLPAVHVFSNMERNGVALDIEYIKKLRKVLQNDINDIELELYKQYHNLRFVNLDSTQQLGDFLFNQLHVIPVNKTAKGAPALRKEDLIVFDEQGLPIAKLLLQRKKLVKQITTYVDSLPKKAGIDRKINSSYSTNRTVTGRLASSGPNLQNIPRDKKIKKMFIADKDFVLLQGDFSQAELRIAASFAEDPVMIDIYSHDGDIHVSTAATIRGIDPLSITDIDRQAAKAVNFGFVYGMQAEGFKEYAKFSYNVEFTRAEAQHARKRYFEKYAMLPVWHEKTKEFVLAHGYVLNPFGRKRRLPDVFSDKASVKNKALRQSINAPVQATASDLCVYTMVNLQKYIEKMKMSSNLILTVHDSIVLNAHKREAEDIVYFLVDLVDSMQAQFSFLRVPMKMDFELGNSWGELFKIKSLDKIPELLTL
jgi:DNA polymerase-1